MHRAILITFISMAAIISYFCMLPTHTSAADISEPFQIEILEPTWESLNIGYDDSTAVGRLMQIANGAKIVASIPLSKIESYDWANQKLVISESLYINHHIFVVRVMGKPKYAGVVLPVESAIAMRYCPVLHSWRVGGKTSLEICPAQLAGKDLDWGQDNEIKEIFAQNHKLTNSK